MRNRAALNAALPLLLVLSLVVPCDSKDWDVVTDSVWELGAPPEYSDAGAIVVFDRGWADWHEKKLKLTRYCRLKALTEGGADSISTLVFQLAKYDDLGAFRGRVLGRNGTETPVTKKTMVKETIGDLTVCTVRALGAKTGDIVEWYYEIYYYGGFDYLGPIKPLWFAMQLGGITSNLKQCLETTDGGNTDRDLEQYVRNLPTWHFDSGFFTYSSEFRVDLFTQIKYAYYLFGPQDTTAEPLVETAFFGARKEYKWSLANIAPYVSPGRSGGGEADRAAIYFNLISTGSGTEITRKDYTADYWNQVGNALRAYLVFYCDKTGKCREKAKELVSGLNETRDRVEAIYEYVATTFKQPMPVVGLRPTNWSVDNLYQSKRGAAFEINVLLLEMLRAVGVSVRPVFINTEDGVSFRKSGHFDHVIVLVDLDGQAVFLDACVDACSAGALPLFSNTDEGLIVDEDAISFCKIVAGACQTRVSYIQSTVP